MTRAQPVDLGQRLFDGGETIDLVAVFRILWRRKWLVLAFALLGAVAASLFALQLTPTYTATVTLMFDPRQPNYGNLEEVVSGLPKDAPVMATQIRLLQSTAFHARVMEDLKLFEDPEFNPFVALPEGTAPVVPREGLEKLLSFVPRDWLVALGLVPEPRPLLESEVALRAREIALRLFAASIEITADQSYVFQLSFTSQDPQKAALVANRIAEMFVDDQLKSKLVTTTRVNAWLEERLATLKDEVARAEAEVQRFRVEHNLVTASSEQGPTLSDQELADLNRELIVARAQLAERQARLRAMQEARARGGLDSVPEVAASPVILNLRAQEAQLARQEAELSGLYGEKHPRMLQLQREKEELRGKIAAELARVAQTLENEVRATAARVAALEAQLSGVKARTAVNREAEVRLRELERQAETSRQLYEAFLQRYKETREQQEIVQPDVHIVAKASVPTAPSSPGPQLFGAAGFGLFFVIGAFVALFRDRLDRTLRSAKEVETLLGLPTLARMPILKLKRGMTPHRYLIEKPLSAYAESIRAVYTSLKLGSADRPPKVVLVTSALPEEGKTTLAVSLATFAARSQRRVVLIDLDLRHPNVHRTLGWQVSAGLVEYLAGERTLEEVICHDLESGVHFLPVKAQTTNPTDLLESARLRETIDRLASQYDLVVVDTAPLGSVTDGKLAALLADKVVFAIRWGATDEAAAVDSVQALREIGIEPAGVVFTMVDVKKHAQYGYGDIGRYYGRTTKYYVD
ncbi:Tyrosine-protein kinase etk [bacterium HR40]|nr:Tyrosine-protein kinase etk [bacterium HR40]